MSFANLGFIGSLVLVLAGLSLFITRTSKDHQKNLSIPVAFVCWGGISLLAFFILGIEEHIPSPAQNKVFIHNEDPFLIGAAIFLASLPVFMWLYEHGWEDQIIRKFIYAVICLTIIIPFVFYKFMN